MNRRRPRARGARDEVDKFRWQLSFDILVGGDCDVPFDEAAFEKLYASNKDGITKNTFFHYCTSQIRQPRIIQQTPKEVLQKGGYYFKADLLYNECGDNWIYLDKGNNSVEVYFWDDNVCRWLREDRKELTHPENSETNTNGINPSFLPSCRF